MRIVGGHMWGFKLLRDVMMEFCEQRDIPTESFTVKKWGDKNCIERFTRSDAHILVHYTLEDIKSGTKRADFCERFLIGQAKAALITNGQRSLSALSVSDVREMLRGSTYYERKRGVKRIPWYGESHWRSISSHVIRRTCMLLGDEYQSHFYGFRGDMTECRSPEEVAAKVARHRGTLGTLLWKGRRPRGVRVIPIGETEDGPFVKPSAEPLIQKDYPLSEYLVLYLKPDAPELARELCMFAVRKTGAEILAREGLVTPYHQHEYESRKRLEAVRNGHGVRVTATAEAEGWRLLEDLSTEYVRASRAMWLSCSRWNEGHLAIRDFLGISYRDKYGSVEDARDLLLLVDKPSDEALERYGEVWNDLMLTGRPLAGRAVAIVVNRANALDSLTMGQVQAIFRGDVRDWRLLGCGGPAGSREELPIRSYGLPYEAPASGVFRDRGIPWDHFRAWETKDSTARALAAVSMDKAAIAFVDLGRIPESGQTVKVLGIRVGMGEDAYVVHPGPEAILTGRYPLSRRMYLYVHPGAGEDARRFAEFLETCGKSEETPCVDTVQSVMDVYREAGLIPLSKTAIERMSRLD